jgi:flagellar assembly protein FliH
MSTSTPFAPLTFPVIRDPGSADAADRARVQGHAAGYAAGRREAAAVLESERRALREDQDRRLAGAIEDARSAAAALAAARAAVGRRVEADADAADRAVLAAAVEIAATILGRELEDVEGSATAAVRRALAGAAGAPVHVIRLHPADLDVASAAGLLATAPEVRYVADATVQRGDAVAELAAGSVDARVGTALDRVRLALAEAEA